MANLCKFEKTEYQVSYDSGVTWENIIPERYGKGDILEYDSQDCTQAQTMYRWRLLDGQYICDGNEKWTKEIQEESYNYGTTWYVSYPTVYRGATLVGVDEDFCNDKFVGHYLVVQRTPSCRSGYAWNGYSCVYVGSGGMPWTPWTRHSEDPLKIVKCDDSGVLTSGDTRYYIDYYPLIECEIGDCVTSLGENAFSGCSSISAITIPSGVTSIGASAFNGCSSLSGISIPSGITSIENSTFQGCSKISGFTIPSGVTSIGNNAFEGCTNLSGISIPSGVTNIGSNAFKSCSNIPSFTFTSPTPPTLGSGAFDNTNDVPIYVPCHSVPSYNSAWSSYTSRIQGIPPCEEPTPTGATRVYAIYNNGDVYYNYCDGRSALSSSDLQPSSYDYTRMTSLVIGGCVTSIPEFTFRNTYSSLTSVTISDGVERIDNNAFRGSTSITNVSIGNTVTQIGDLAFYECSGLTDVSIGSGVTYIGRDAFVRCTRLRSANIPRNITNIGNGAFMSCYALSNPIVIPSGVTSIGYGTFSYCYSLSSITFEEGSRLTSIGAYAFDKCYGLSGITIPSGVTTIGGYAFEGCINLSAITIPSGVTSIEQHAFSNCSGLTSITCLATTPPTLNSPGAQFYGSTCPIYVPCESVAAYKSAWSSYSSRIQGFPPCDITFKFSATYIGGQTYSAECDSSSYITTANTKPSGYQYSAMTSAEVGECVTSISSNAFDSFGNITNIILDNGVENIGMYAFRRCSSLTSITLPPSLTTLNEGVFYGCTSLPTVDIPNGITGIPYGLFSGCTSLSTITIPSGVTVISTYAFRYCSSLSALVIPNGVNVIGQYAFDGCSSMASCTIGSGVTSIGQFAFLNCSGLTSITCLAPTPPSIDSYMFNTTNNCPIYVPASSLETYKSATNWSSYADRIQPIT
jgi:hypothetical protein